MIPLPRRLLAAGAVTAALAGSAGAAAPPAAADIPPAGGATLALKPQTLASLMRSMHGEAYAGASYTLFAEQARRQQLPEIARLLRSTARTEVHEHFLNEATLAGLIASDTANLRDAITGESYESRTMYPGFARQAARAGDTNAASLFADIARDEAGHAAAFRAALRAITSGQGSIPVPPVATPVPVQPGGPAVTAPRTLASVTLALRGEAFAYAKYTGYARHARAHGDAALARLFAGTARVELREHFTAEAALAGIVGTTRANLATAIAGERREARHMYPAFARRAAAAGDAQAAELFRHDAADEAGHARAFEQALARLRAVMP